MNGPKISAIIPTLNEERFLPLLLNSLSGQSVQPYEVIVSDGSSTDKTVQIARTYKNKLPGLKVVVSKRASLPLQRNEGAKAASGEWFLFLDSDTVLMPYAVERLAWFIADKRSELFTTWFRPDSEEGSDAVYTLIANMFVEGAKLLKRDIAPGPLAAMNKRVFNLVNGYDESLTFGEDYDITQRLSQAGVRLEILRETLFVHSLRRLRREGKMKFLNTYVKASLLVLLTKKNYWHMPGYIMGGHLYTKRKVNELKRSELITKIRQLTNQLFV